MQPDTARAERGGGGGSAFWRLAHGRSLVLGERGRLMAIVNVTPDSFSDGGAHATVEAAVAHAHACLADGADILDIGGESTRPGAAPVSVEEECGRVLPVITALAAAGQALISIDTYRAETARRAVEAGAHIINDVHGLQREPEIAAVAAETGAGLCIMHTGRGRERLADPIADQLAFFERSLAIARSAGVGAGQIVLDPGFGFAKETVEDNMALIARFSEILAIGYPLLVGTSRKRFLGALTDRAADRRDDATAASTVALRLEGAAIFRVHAVKPNRDALAVADALIAARNRLKDRNP